VVNDKIETIDGLYTPEQAAAFLKVTRRKIIELCKAGRITHQRFDHWTIRFKKEHLEAYADRYTRIEKGVTRA
jgi:excisionase family DNA binding protein